MLREERRADRAGTPAQALRRSAAPAGPCPSGGTKKRPGTLARLPDRLRYLAALAHSQDAFSSPSRPRWEEVWVLNRLMRKRQREEAYWPGCCWPPRAPWLRTPILPKISSKKLRLRPSVGVL